MARFSIPHIVNLTVAGGTFQPHISCSLADAVPLAPVLPNYCHGALCAVAHRLKGRVALIGVSCHTRTSGKCIITRIDCPCRQHCASSLPCWWHHCPTKDGVVFGGCHKWRHLGQRKRGMQPTAGRKYLVLPYEFRSLQWNPWWYRKSGLWSRTNSFYGVC